MITQDIRRRRHNAHSFQKGFTVVEILVIIGTIGILATLAIHNINRYNIANDVIAANNEVIVLNNANITYQLNSGSGYARNSDILQASTYIKIEGTVKAKYTYDISTGKITQVDAVVGGWQHMVFDISDQKWEMGKDDNTGAGTQDRG